VIHSIYPKTNVDVRQTVLLVGAGVSSTDIARELNSMANKTYQVSRGGVFDLPANFLPENAERVNAIASFEFLPNPEPGKININGYLKENEGILASVTLVDGRVLTDIDQVIICTGYHIS
jgi:cation diffusion facilitator CzcD-associated flavoprotein CzcO